MITWFCGLRCTKTNTVNSLDPVSESDTTGFVTVPQVNHFTVTHFPERSRDCVV